MVKNIYCRFLTTGVLSIGMAGCAGDLFHTNSSSGSRGNAAADKCQGTDLHNCKNREGLPRNNLEKDVSRRNAGQDSIPAHSDQSRGQSSAIGMDRDVSSQTYNGASSREGTGIAPGNAGR